MSLVSKNQHINDSEVDIESEPTGCAEYFDTSVNQMRFFADLLSHEGVEYGLIGPRETSRIWSRHILNCCALIEYLPEGEEVADVGSGAGLPGLVLAIARPDLNLCLIEFMERRVNWLEDVSEQLGLDNVEIIHSRAEQLHGKYKFSYLTARAVGNLSTLLNWTAPLLKPAGTMLLLKGQSVNSEIAKAKEQYLFRKFKLSLPEVIEAETPVTHEMTRVAKIIKK